MIRVGLNTLTGKLVASVAVLGSAGAVAGLGTFGSFTATTSASTSVGSGTVALSLGTSGTSANRLSVAAAGLVPSDTVQRAVDLIDSGNQSLGSISLTTSATTSSLLDTSATMGLTVKLDTCSVAWTETGVAPAYVYTCSGTTSAVLAAVPVIQTAVALTNLTALTPGSTDHLRLTLALPALADNTLQNQSSVIGLTFTGTQRAGTNK